MNGGDIKVIIYKVLFRLIYQNSRCGLSASCSSKQRALVRMLWLLAPNLHQGMVRGMNLAVASEKVKLINQLKYLDLGLTNLW